MIGLAVAASVFAPQIAAALIPGLVAGSATALAVTAVAALAITAAGTLLLNRVFPAPSAASGAAGAIQNYRQSIAQSAIVYGQRRIGGLIVFFHPRKAGKKHYRYFVIAAAGHRSKGVVQWMLNDEAVSVAADGRVTSGTYRDGAYLWFARGTDDQAANATFVAECGGKWTDAHRGRGVTAIYARFEMTDDIVQAGMPTITAVIEGKDDILDVRDGSVGYTRNAQLVWRDWLAMPREEGGFGARADELDDDWDAVYANVCDETCATPDGDEARYVFDSAITTGAAPSEVRTTFVTSCGGAYTCADGYYRLRPGCWEPSSAVLHEDDLAGAITVSPFLGGDEATTEVSVTYIDPANGYQAQAAPTRSVASDEVKQADADLPHVTSVWQAQRVGEIILRRAQCEKKVSWPMNIAGLGITALDTVTCATARYGLSNYAFQVTSWGISQDFSVALSLREENAEIYDDPVYVLPGTGGELAQAEPVPTAAETATTYNLILTSYTLGLLAGVDVAVSGSTATIVLPDHQRVYGDRTVSVAGATIGGITASGVVLIYYDDDDRSGGAVDYAVTTVAADAYQSIDHPARHFVFYWDFGAAAGGGASPAGTGGGRISGGATGTSPNSSGRPGANVP